MNRNPCIGKPIKVVIVTQYVLLGEGIERILGDKQGITVLGRVSGIQDAIESGHKYKADVMLVDSDIWEQGYIKLIEYLKGNRASAKVLLLTDKFNEDAMLRLLAFGVHGYLTKHTLCYELVKAIKTAHNGEIWAERQLMSNLITQSSHSSINGEKLSSREEEIARFVAQGYSNKEIAAKLFISEKTVKCHLTTIFKKMGVNSRLKVAVQFLNIKPPNIKPWP